MYKYCRYKYDIEEDTTGLESSSAPAPLVMANNYGNIYCNYLWLFMLVVRVP